MTDRDADILLDTIRRSMVMAIVAERTHRDGEQRWRIEAHAPPHRYLAEAEDYREAALALALLVGFDVMDG